MNVTALFEVAPATSSSTLEPSYTLRNGTNVMPSLTRRYHRCRSSGEPALTPSLTFTVRNRNKFRVVTRQERDWGNVAGVLVGDGRAGADRDRRGAHPGRVERAQERA